MRGIGDDATVVKALKLCVTTVDTVVEGTHFSLDDPELSFGDIGWKALAGGAVGHRGDGGTDRRGLRCAGDSRARQRERRRSS